MRLVTLALACCAACDTGVTAIALGPLDANPACEEAKTHSDLPWIQANIFDQACSSSTACHKDRALDAAELSLSDGTSYAALVGVDAKSDYGTTVKGRMQWKRVVAGDPSSSYLMVLIDPHENPVPNGPVDPMGGGYGSAADLNPKSGSMPQNAGELLCPERIDAIRRWIENGAPEN
jgi:hypothetical protein